mgnify:CR=1 FL=1
MGFRFQEYVKLEGNQDWVPVAYTHLTLPNKNEGENSRDPRSIQNQVKNSFFFVTTISKRLFIDLGTIFIPKTFRK